MTPKILVTICTYGKPLRLAKVLDAFKETADLVYPDTVVIEDFSTEEVSAGYKKLCDDNFLPHVRADKWVGMQGAAELALRTAEREGADWVIYWPDDAFPTPGTCEWLYRWIETLDPVTEGQRVGAIQAPYWNYEDLTGRMKDEAWSGDLEWLQHVRWNPHWFGPAYYINVNGAGFAIRVKAWRDAGGFPTKTWCLDEHISNRLWLYTPWEIVTVPGPPMIHVGGAATPEMHKNGHTQLREATLDGWMDEWGIGKEELGERCRARMRERSKQTGIQDR